MTSLVWFQRYFSYIVTGQQGILWICGGRGHQNGPMAPLLFKMYIKLTKIRGPFAKTAGHQGKWRGRWTVIWGPRPKLTAYLDRLYRGPFHIWSQISSILQFSHKLTMAHRDQGYPWTVVQFPNLDLLPSTIRHGQLGVFSVTSLPWHGHRDVRRHL